MMKTKVLMAIAFVSIVSSLFIFSANKAFAQGADVLDAQAQQCTDSGGVWNNLDGRCMTEEEVATMGDCGDTTLLGIPTWYKYLEGETISGKCKPVISSPMDAIPIVLAVFEAALTLGGIVAVVMVFIGGFKYVLAQGEADKAAGGRKTVINAFIGLLIIILSIRVVAFIGSRFGA